MASNPNPSQNDSDEDTSQKEFAFVQHESSQKELRSHAMREHWKNRRHVMKEEKQKRQKRPQHMLLPTPPTGHRPTLLSTTSNETTESSSSASNRTASFDRAIMSNSDREAGLDGIPHQVLAGMNVALGSSRLDPFEKFPVKLTIQHHRLLHHWFSAHATMMFEPSDRAFNPMRDVWLPLDLSNAASLNAIMAHSAAHLSRMQGFSESKEALEFKSEAVKIVQLWMNDPELAVSDDVLAAILRFLTYEACLSRYWGTEAEWIIHRRGLLNLIEARGGIGALKNNWRLELATFLASLMARPSCFDCSNQIQELSNQALDLSLHPILSNGGNLQKVRSLWLLSFIQDMGTFRSNFIRSREHRMAQYTALHEAVVLLKTHRQVHEEDAGRPDLCSDLESTRLACLLFICVLLQQALSDFAPITGSTQEGGQSFHQMEVLAVFTFFLDANKSTWQSSLHDLYDTLFFHFPMAEGTGLDTDYVQHMTSIMASMDGRVRYAVERCLLEILCRTNGSEQDIYEEEWTPDILLSWIPG